MPDGPTYADCGLPNPYTAKDQIDRMQAEIERLRAALSWYADCSLEDYSKDNGYKASCVLEGAALEQRVPVKFASGYQHKEGCDCSLCVMQPRSNEQKVSHADWCDVNVGQDCTCNLAR